MNFYEVNIDNDDMQITATTCKRVSDVMRVTVPLNPVPVLGVTWSPCLQSLPGKERLSKAKLAQDCTCQNCYLPRWHNTRQNCPKYQVKYIIRKTLAGLLTYISSTDWLGLETIVCSLKKKV